MQMRSQRSLKRFVESVTLNLYVIPISGHIRRNSARRRFLNDLPYCSADDFSRIIPGPSETRSNTVTVLDPRTLGIDA